MISRAKKISIVTSVAVSVVFLAFFGYATWLKFFPAKQGYGTFVTTLELPALRQAHRRWPPAGMLPGSPFGPGIAALAIYLHTRHMVS